MLRFVSQLNVLFKRMESRVLMQNGGQENWHGAEGYVAAEEHELYLLVQYRS
jgi:hypothetical protein